MCKVLLECINRFRPVVVTCLSEEGFTASTYHAVAALLGFDEQNGRALLSSFKPVKLDWRDPSRLSMSAVDTLGFLVALR